MYWPCMVSGATPGCWAPGLPGMEPGGGAPGGVGVSVMAAGGTTQAPAAQAASFARHERQDEEPRQGFVGMVADAELHADAAAALGAGAEYPIPPGKDHGVVLVDLGLRRPVVGPVNRRRRDQERQRSLEP